MRPEELKRLLTSMKMAAEVVEAIDEPALQTERGWDLAGWSYDCIPWGVRFVRRDDRQRLMVIRVVVIPEPAATLANCLRERSTLENHSSLSIPDPAACVHMSDDFRTCGPN
jgi:hypothetical protein